MDNPYKILGVPKNATDEELKKAYRDLVKKYHPDNNIGVDTNEKLKEIKEAYESIINHKKEQNDDDLWWEQVQKGAGDFNQKNAYNNQAKENHYSSFEQPIYDDIVSSHFKIYLDEYIKFLDENEERANKCGMSLKHLKKEAYSMNPIMAFDKKRQVEAELYKVERKCKKFDYFMEFVDKTYEESMIYSRLLNIDKIKELVKDKRGTMTEVEIEKLMKQIAIETDNMKKERQEKLELLRYKLITERKIVFDDYLEIRNYNFYNVPYKVIKDGLNCLELMTEIEKQLLPFGITIDNLLASIGKSLIEVEYNELVRIKNITNTLIFSNKPIDVENITQIYSNEQTETKKK